MLIIFGKISIIIILFFIGSIISSNYGEFESLDDIALADDIGTLEIDNNQIVPINSVSVATSSNEADSSLITSEVFPSSDNEVLVTGEANSSEEIKDKCSICLEDLHYNIDWNIKSELEEEYLAEYCNRIGDLSKFIRNSVEKYEMSGVPCFKSKKHGLHLKCLRSYLFNSEDEWEIKCPICQVDINKIRKRVIITFVGLSYGKYSLMSDSFKLRYLFDELTIPE